MRTITTHRVNECNDGIALTVLDEPGSGGASHRYRIKLPRQRNIDTDTFDLNFQNGPIKEAGINGITQEVLLAVVADRLQSFQAGPYACQANKEALDFINKAIETLHSRTKERDARGVEGTHAV